MVDGFGFLVILEGLIMLFQIILQSGLIRECFILIVYMQVMKV